MLSHATHIAQCPFYYIIIVGCLKLLHNKKSSTRRTECEPPMVVRTPNGGAYRSVVVCM